MTGPGKSSTQNLALTGLTSEDLAETLGWDVAHADATLAVMGTDPRDIWLVRDYLEREITSAGGMPRPYSTPP
ncbi:DUF2316 family protein [Rothia halotolerans]|uniref:DUF2316 family protein n=1 Tax=Rothia halotolerans TaxID=405770 RepID=UPI00101BA86D|nr:DUF2316 family protein [Rothia halotolerans]